jgi:hypothetical protein
MHESSTRRTFSLSPAWVLLMILAVYVLTYLPYRILGPVEVDTSVPQPPPRIETITDPATGETHTRRVRSIVCGYAPPRVRADTSTSGRLALAAFFQPALKMEEMGRRTWDDIEALARQVWRSWL